MVSRFLSLLLLFSATLLSGCASSGPNPFQEGAGGDRTIQVTIDNQNFNDATIRAHWRGGSEMRVGTVNGNSSETFTLRHRSDVVRFEVDFLAGGGYMGNSISVSPGDHLRMVVRSGG